MRLVRSAEVHLSIYIKTNFEVSLYFYRQLNVICLYICRHYRHNCLHIYRQMSVKDTVRRQIVRKISESARNPANTLRTPPGGWIATVRKALGMSGAQLGKRLSLKRGRISQAELAEAEGGVTLRTMQEMAEAMGCRFVYAIVPANGDLNDLIEAQARRKATEIVSRAATHMALEQQSLSAEQNKAEIDRLTRALVADPPSHFWD